MTRSLTRLIDNSLLPAALVVVSKVIGLSLTIIIFHVPWTLNSVPNSFFSLRPLLFSNDIVLVSTYSDIFMFSIIMIGFSAVLIQSLFFHDTHISPKNVIHLASNNLLSLIKNSFDVYHNGVVWGIYLWLSNLLILINVLIQKTNSWVFIITIVITIVLTLILLNDVSDEITLRRKSILGSNDSSHKIST